MIQQYQRAAIRQKVRVPSYNGRERERINRERGGRERGIRREAESGGGSTAQAAPLRQALPTGRGPGDGSFGISSPSGVERPRAALRT